MVLFFTSTICNKSCAVYTPPASTSLAICRWCDICIFNIRNKDVVVVVVICIPRSLNMSRELSIPCQDTELQKQSAKMTTKDKHRETRACIPRSLSVSLELTVPCQYTEFQKAISENKHGGETEGNVFTSFFKREPQGKYKSALEFSDLAAFSQIRQFR